MPSDAACFAEPFAVFPDTGAALGRENPARDAAWLAYLHSLAGRGVVSPIVTSNAASIWRNLRSVVTHIAIPDAAVTEEFGLFMSWDRGTHHLDIEVSDNGRYEWFYRDRDTDEFSGDYDYPATTLSPDLLVKLRLVAENA